MACLVQVAEKAGQQLEDLLADPTRSIEAEIERINADHASQRGEDSDRGVEFGGRLIWLKAQHGPANFATVLKRLHISERTARNKIALALFANRYPELYARFKTLGPTKLYRLAVLNPEEIRHLHLEDPVETSRGKIMIRQLTSTELDTFLRSVVPPKARRPWILRASQDVARAQRNLARAVGESNDVGDVELLRSQLQKAIGLLLNLKDDDTAGRGPTSLS